MILTLFLSMMTQAAPPTPLPPFHEVRPPVLISLPDPFLADPDCADYKTGCLRVREKTWRKSNRQPDFSLMKKQTPTCIVIHNTGELASPRSPIEKVRNLYDFSIRPDPTHGRKSLGGKPAWGDIPYHFYIDQFGNLVQGRSPDYEPDTNTVELNVDGKINVVIEGDYNDHVKKDDGEIVQGNRFSAQQEKVTREMVKYLKVKYGITGVSAHRLLAPTDCPGDDIMRKLKDLFTSCPK